MSAQPTPPVSAGPPDAAAHPATVLLNLPTLDAQARRALMRGGSKTFFAASLLLPPRVREPATALYAYCRLADDDVDLGDDPHAAMRDLCARLDSIYEGRPGPVDADRALAQVVHRHAIPRALLDALLEGFLWDAQGQRYETLSDVLAYSARVAGTVGAMMALVMETRTPQAVARACELGLAMQLTNIARDVGEDARNGRLYLPRQWMAEAGLDAEAFLRAPAFSPALGGVVQRLLQEADRLYARAEAGIAELPLDCRPAILSARRVYAEIGHQLAREGLDSVSHRAVVSRGRKLALLAASTGAALRVHAAGADAEPQAEIAFLVDAVERCPLPSHLARRRSLDDRMEWASRVHERLLELEHERSMARQKKP
ncbi:MAG: prephytoene pyrophosphate synthase CrtB [Pseudomonadota bacterium]